MKKKACFLAMLSDYFLIYLPKASHKMYIQVCETLGDESTLERELTPFRAIQDNYEKLIITNDNTFVESYEGIKVKNTADWLCE